MKAKYVKGTLKTVFITIIPLLLIVSKSRITNGQDVEEERHYAASGFVFALHILGIFEVGFVIPGFLINLWEAVTNGEPTYH